MRCCAVGLLYQVMWAGTAPAADQQQVHRQNQDDLLQRAVRAGDVQTAQQLYSGGAGLNREVYNFLLCEAAYKGAAKVSRFLLVAGADASHVDTAQASGGRTPLHYAIAGYDEANRLDHGKDLGTGDIPRRSGVVRLLLQHGAGLWVLDAHGMTALHAAVRARWARAVQLIIGATSQQSQLRSLLEIRSGGTDPRHANQTALLLATAGVRRGLMLAATTSIKHPPPLSSDSMAGAHRHNALKSWGLQLQPTAVGGASSISRSTLELGLSGWSCALTRPLLTAGADVDARDSGGWQALHYAADFGDVALISLLLEAGASVASRTGGTNGLLAVELSARKGLVEATSLLVAAQTAEAAVHGESDLIHSGRAALKLSQAVLSTSRYQALVEQTCEGNITHVDRDSLLHGQLQQRDQSDTAEEDLLWQQLRMWRDGRNRMGEPSDVVSQCDLPRVSIETLLEGAGITTRSGGTGSDDQEIHLHRRRVIKRAFRERVLRYREPVLLTLTHDADPTDGSSASNRWAWDELLTLFGSGESGEQIGHRYAECEFAVGSIPYATQYGLPNHRQTLGQFINASRGRKLNALKNERGDSHHHPELECLFETRLDKSCPALLRDLMALIDSNDGRMQATGAFHGLRTHPLQFLLGGAGTGAPMHFHQDAYNLILHGSKRWFLLPPSNATLSREQPLMWLRHHMRRVVIEETDGVRPEQLVTAMRECTQRAGEVIYIPDSWSHAVINLEETTAMAVEFYPDLRSL